LVSRKRKNWKIDFTIMIRKCFFGFLIVLVSCAKQSALQEEFNCSTETFNNLETVQDVHNLFSISLPKHWKTNLYEDALQSSIFSADTTKQLSETYLIDVSYVKNSINFDDLFKLKIEQNNLSKKLIQTKTKELLVMQKPSYLCVSKGKKATLIYQKLELYIKLNSTSFIQAKAEIYGDSLVNQKLCKAIQLIKQIKINQ